MGEINMRRTGIVVNNVVNFVYSYYYIEILTNVTFFTDFDLCIVMMIFDDDDDDI